MHKTLRILTLLLLLVTAVSLWLTQEQPNISSSAGRSEGSGEAAIGGGFTLNNQLGERVSDLQFRGRLMLVFFGFTHCPDICPTTALALSNVMGKLGDQADQVVPIFITVDPERDTPDVLKNYFAGFDSRIVALTGMPDEIKAVAAAYKAYYAKATPEDSQDTAPTAHGDYLMDHSGFIYLMNRDGKYVTHFPYNADEQEILNAIHNHLTP